MVKKTPLFLAKIELYCGDSEKKRQNFKIDKIFEKNTKVLVPAHK